MLNVRQILVSAIGLSILGVALTACGQKGPLYLPTDPAARDRATLPSLLVPGGGDKDEATDAQAPEPAAPASVPAPATTEGTK